MQSMHLTGVPIKIEGLVLFEHLSFISWDKYVKQFVSQSCLITFLYLGLN